MTHTREQHLRMLEATTQSFDRAEQVPSPMLDTASTQLFPTIAPHIVDVYERSHPDRVNARALREAVT